VCVRALASVLPQHDTTHRAIPSVCIAALGHSNSHDAVAVARRSLVAAPLANLSIRALGSLWLDRN
jgi:hypothetical protein